MPLKRIPTPTQDAGNWGTILNDHLSQTQNPLNGAFNSFDQFSNRPTNLSADDVGRAYINAKTGNIHEWQGSTWKVMQDSVINVMDFGVKGDGVADDSAIIQNLVNQYEVLFFPKGDYRISGVVIPETKRVKLFGDGNIICSGNYGFMRTNTISRDSFGVINSTEGNLVPFEIFVEDLTFTASNSECKCIWLDHYFSSSGNFGLNITKCFFKLSNGAIGIALSGCGFNRIISNYFVMDTNSFAIVTIAAQDLLKSCQTSVAAYNVFFLGTAIIQRYQANTISAVEGWNSISNMYFASRFNMIMANTWRAINEDFVSSHIVIDGCNASQISNCYIDHNVFPEDVGFPLIDIKSNPRNTQSLQITNNIINSQGAGGDMIVFSGATSPTTPNQITAVTISGNTYQGQQNIGNNGIVFNAKYGGPSRVFIGGETFFNITSCIKIITPFVKNTIAPFQARDCQYWLENASAAGLNIEAMTERSNIDFVYQKIPCTLTVPTYLASTAEEVVSSYTVNFGRMGTFFPVITTASISSTELETYPFVSNKTNTSFDFEAVKRIPALGGRRFVVKADVIVDGTKYLYGGE